MFFFKLTWFFSNYMKPSLAKKKCNYFGGKERKNRCIEFSCSIVGL